MYKEIIMIFCVIALIVTLDVITNNYTKTSVNLLTEELLSLEQSLKDKNNEEITSKMSNINNEWEKRYSKLAYYIEHDELEKVGTEITRLSAYINVQEYDEAQNETATTVFILQHIEDKEKFSVRSIF